MFFILSKILVILIRPLAWMLALGIWAILTKNQRRRKKLLLISTVLLFLSSNKVLVNELLRLWEMPPQKELIDLPETAVILGGYAEWDEHRDRVQLTEAAERMYVPVNLYRQGKIKQLLLTGGAASLTGRTKPEADYVKPILISSGIPDSAIWIENRSRNTHENALNTLALLKERGVKDAVLLVTSAFHMRRAAAVFRKAGIGIVPYPVHYISDYGRGYYLPDWFIPSSEALFRLDALTKEWVGYLAYAITGKL